MSDDDDKVGYKRPPKSTQWKKGESGNPRGRTKGGHNLKNELLKELSEIILIREGGTPKKVSKLRALLKAQTAKAVQGDSKATGLLLSTMIRVPDEMPTSCDKATVSEDDREIIEAFFRRRAERGEGA